MTPRRRGEGQGVDRRIPDRPDPAGPAPLDREQARALTAQIRESIAAVERAWAVLAERVRRAHEGRAWVALGYVSWGRYAAAEFGIGRAHAYRLIDIATTTADRLLSMGSGPHKLKTHIRSCWAADVPDNAPESRGDRSGEPAGRRYLGDGHVPDNRPLSGTSTRVRRAPPIRLLASGNTW
ncbi:hypothetical protein AB0J63_46995 [Streptosporangium canum]|uniref:hypothetical protein n=1 Tax=Streptosporangium canum TaxID=324952 RepID=UPI0034282A1A